MRRVLTSSMHLRVHRASRAWPTSTRWCRCRRHRMPPATTTWRLLTRTESRAWSASHVRRFDSCRWLIPVLYITTNLFMDYCIQNTVSPSTVNRSCVHFLHELHWRTFLFSCWCLIKSLNRLLKDCVDINWSRFTAFIGCRRWLMLVNVINLHCRYALAGPPSLSRELRS